MASPQKSLTDPPKNLKEAIDWVIKIKNDNNTDDLAKELHELLKHDGAEVAMKVLDKYRLVSKSVIEKLKSHTNDKNRLTSLSSEWGFAVPHAILNSLSQGLDPFVSGSVAISREKAERWLTEVQEKTLETPVTELANGIEAFVAQGTGIVQGSVPSAYSQADAKWKGLQAAERMDCAIIFLAILPLLYVALTYLYWRCSQSPDSSGLVLSWSGQSPSTDNGLKKYMAALGYSDDLKSQNGSVIAGLIGKMFSGELSKDSFTDNEYPKFLGKLQKLAPESLRSNPTSHPLTSLYLLSHYYITTFLYDVQSTSPASPSFAGYSGLTALAGGAYGLNLGGLGTLMSALLA
ncbi:variant erythrocyte surface antigen-1 family protein [Babesia caballi]|uniref:Variant erythrocyte surface antigen-1 family protein n=1 Tax=Babesia caballi TaxID=5871 RepID=A0AAV4LT82_BABCB|nr:variant erythrocyte surface antigen-1 family protein [Babesia caballi]